MKRTLRLGAGLAAGLAAALSIPAGAFSNELQAPFRVEANGSPINVEIGHAAPFVHDFDGDGVFDLLVGQFGGGKLRIYRNTGSNREAKFEGFAWFKTGTRDGTVPAG